MVFLCSDFHLLENSSHEFTNSSFSIFFRFHSVSSLELCRFSPSLLPRCACCKYVPAYLLIYFHVHTYIAPSSLLSLCLCLFSSLLFTRCLYLL